MKPDFEKIKENIKKFLRKFWQNLFLILILLLVLDFILAGIFFWQYYLTAQDKEPQIIPPLKINQVLMEKVSAQWSQREIIFEGTEEKQYLDPFRGLIE